MTDLHRRYFSISRMSSARTDVTMAQIRALARDHDDDRLALLCDKARAAARSTADIEAAHRLQSEARADGEAAAVDKRMDIAVGGLFDGLDDEITYLRSVNDPRADVLQKLMDVHFGGQVSTITRAPYEDELQRVERLHVDLTGPYAELIAAVGLTRWVRRIEADLEPYRQALSARSRVTNGDLTSARWSMHVVTCAVVGHICSVHLGDDETVQALLAPLTDQQDRIAAIMRARRQGVATGAVDGDLDADLIAGDGEALDAAVDEAPGAAVDDTPTAPPVAPEVSAEADPPTVRPLPGRDDA